MHPFNGKSARLQPAVVSKPHNHENRKGWRSVQIWLDRDYSSVIPSLKLKDGGGVAIPLVIDSKRRERCVHAQRDCSCTRNSLYELLSQLGGFDSKPVLKKPNLKRQGFVLGGGRALEPCKSL